MDGACGAEMLGLGLIDDLFKPKTTKIDIHCLKSAIIN